MCVFFTGLRNGRLHQNLDLEKSIKRNKPYFEISSDSSGKTKRYSGNDSSYFSSLTEADLDYMGSEIDKLNPVFGYVARERA